MSKAAELAALIGSQTALSNRNLIINGAFSIFQRGTSFTSQTGVAYHADRFETQAHNVGTGVYKAEQSTEAPDGFYHSLKYSCTTADTSQDANNQLYIQQQIEAQNIYHLKFYEDNPDSVTVSFYVRSNTTGSYGMTLKLSDNNSSDVSTGTRIYPTTFTISSADTWEKITKTITLDSSTSETRPTGNNMGMALVIWLAAGSSRQGATANAWAGNGNATVSVDADDFLGSTSNNFHLTGVQIEVGEQDTFFEHEDYNTTLRKCQRYYAKSYSDGTAVGTASTTVGAIMVYIPATGNSLRYTLHYPQQMRATPTFTAYNPETGTSSYGAYEGSGDTNAETVSYTFNGNKSALLFNTNMNYTGSFYWQWGLDAEL
jgi:hypothetical protein